MDYQELLLRHDDPTHWEYPPGFDYRAATTRFDRFVKELRATLGTELRHETGIHIQDASFHSQVFLPLSDDRFALIRFSNFGDMVSISDDNSVPDATVRLLQELFSRHGYVCVPALILAAPYTGPSPGVTGIDTWWTRYFDWV